MCIADIPSRAHPLSSLPAEDKRIEEMELKIDSLVSSLLLSNDKMNLLKQATAAGDFLQMVKNLIKGWPAYKRDTPSVQDNTGHYVTNYTL